MDERVKKYFQLERMHAIDEFIMELNHYICDVKKYYRRDRWETMIGEVRELMYKGRDFNRDRVEPIIVDCHCAHFDKSHKPCSAKAVQGPYCKKHATSKVDSP